MEMAYIKCAGVLMLGLWIILLVLIRDLAHIKKTVKELEKNKLRKITATHKHELNTQNHGRLHGFFGVGMVEGFALIEYADGHTEELPLEKYQFTFTDKDD